MSDQAASLGRGRPTYPSDALDWLLPAGDRAALLDRVRTLTATHPDLAGRDTFPLPYVTQCARADLPHR